jgi:hypothetical protein
MSDQIEETTEAKPLPRQTAEAQEQADEHGGLGRSAKITAHKSGEEFIVRNVIMLDDDELVAYEKLHFLMNQCDRHPDFDSPAQRFVHKTPEGTVTETETGAHTQRGDFIQPYQKDGVLIEPPYSIQMAIIQWGTEGYARFKAGGGRSAEIPDKMRQLNTEMQRRVNSDSKSDGGSVDLAPSTDGD